MAEDGSHVAMAKKSRTRCRLRAIGCDGYPTAGWSDSVWALPVCLPLQGSGAWSRAGRATRSGSDCPERLANAMLSLLTPSPDPSMWLCLQVHPVGIGLSSWFWDRFIGEWSGGAVFTIDLIGCGDSDPWEPADEGMFVPLDWVRAIEALWREQIGRKCVVVVQGGLAPVGVQLAARRTSEFNGADAVGGLVLASPPTFEAMRQGLDQEQVAKNWRWLTSPPGQASYYLLRLRAFVSFFSNLFLFRDRADEEFVQRACRGATIEARWPVFAFNSGLVIAKGFADEIETIAGEGLKVMILSGSDDGRTAKREASALSLIPSCQLVRIAGKNVLPWESARDTAAAILDMAQTITA